MTRLQRPGHLHGAAAAQFPAGGPHCSIGHWIEDDPHCDGAFSSAGAFGFYPWISRDETTWGVLARFSWRAEGARAGAASLAWGRRIRAAWMTGEAG